jgi:AcrR family transcriptional regulator
MKHEKKTRGRPATFDRVAALGVATELFWSHGYDGTSIAMLTEQMGITPPTLYGAFGSKEELYYLALNHYLQQDDQCVPVEGDGNDPYRATESFLRSAAISFTQPGKPKGCMVVTGSLQSGAGNERVTQAACNARMLALSAFITQLEEAKEAGAVPRSVDCEALARFYASVVEGMSVQAIDGASAQQLNAVVDIALAAWPRESSKTICDSESVSV